MGYIGNVFALSRLKQGLTATFSVKLEFDPHSPQHASNVRQAALAFSMTGLTHMNKTGNKCQSFRDETRNLSRFIAVTFMSQLTR